MKAPLAATLNGLPALSASMTLVPVARPETVPPMLKDSEPLSQAPRNKKQLITAAMPADRRARFEYINACS